MGRLPHGVKKHTTNLKWKKSAKPENHNEESDADVENEEEDEDEEVFDLGDAVDDEVQSFLYFYYIWRMMKKNTIIFEC